MNKECCMACNTPHDTARQPHHFPEGRPYAWICDGCWQTPGHDDVIDAAREGQGTPDLVNEPPHYKGLVVRVKNRDSWYEDIGDAGKVDSVSIPIESIELIEGFGFGFNLGNVVKYLYRSNEKGDRLENLRKSAWYLQREIDNG